MKIVLTNYESSSGVRALTLEGEASLLARCAGIPGVPTVERYHETPFAQILYLSLITGSNASTIALTKWRLILIVLRLAVILFRLSLRGVSHNDVLLSNVIVCDDGSVALLDFDQATTTSVGRAFLLNFFGCGASGVRVRNSLGRLVMTKLKSFVRRRILPSSSLSAAGSEALPLLPPSAPPELRALREAWELGGRSGASAPGRNVAYYSLYRDGVHFPGERPWVERWHVLRSLAPCAGKTVLELGCNMALLSTHLRAYEGARQAIAVDHDRQILKAASLVAKAYGQSIEFVQVDFDLTHNWESMLLAYQPDVVFALNVLNWVAKRARFLEFLRRCPVVVYEGHDHFSIERERLQRAGMAHLSFAGASDRDRPIIVIHNTGM